MSLQVSRDDFAQALRELGHDPQQFAGKRLTLEAVEELYELDADAIVEAIDGRHIAAHYDYLNEVIWIDALDAAHFYYCVRACAEM